MPQTTAPHIELSACMQRDDLLMVNLCNELESSNHPFLH